MELQAIEPLIVIVKKNVRYVSHMVMSRNMISGIKGDNMLTFMKVTGIVRICESPELHYTPNQKAVVNFPIAANSTYTSNGSKHEESCFISCTAWGKLAESINKYVEKGDPLYIEGDLKQESWEKDNVKHIKHTVTLSSVIFIKSKDKE